MTVPTLTRPRRARKLTVDERTLDTGLRVLAVRKPGVPLVELRLRIRSSAPARPTRRVPRCSRTPCSPAPATTTAPAWPPRCRLSVPTSRSVSTPTGC